MKAVPRMYGTKGKIQICMIIFDMTFSSMALNKIKMSGKSSKTRLSIPPMIRVIKIKGNTNESVLLVTALDDHTIF